MKKIALITLMGLVTLPVFAEDVNCGKGNTKAEKMICKWVKGTANAYFTGCFDIYAPEVGVEKAATVCLAEYEQHKYNKSLIRAAKAEVKAIKITI